LFLPKVVSRHRRSLSRRYLRLARRHARRWPQAAIHSSPMEEAIGLALIELSSGASAAGLGRLLNPLTDIKRQEYLGGASCEW
jgi:hypothetical protein